MMASLCRMRPPVSGTSRGASPCTTGRCAIDGCHSAWPSKLSLRSAQAARAAARYAPGFLDFAELHLYVAQAFAAERHNDDSHSLLSVADVVVGRFGAGLGAGSGGRVAG